jgi:fructose-bisphosphate aldolase class II
MPVATPEQYAAMLDAAAAGGHALAAVNVTSSQTLVAALRGFAEAGADGIVEITVGGGEYLSGAGDAAAGAAALAAYARAVAESYPVLVGLHTDHCPPDRLDDFVWPLLALSAERLHDGEEPLFNSHMFDGSTLALEDNLEISAGLLEACARLGVVLEVECGVVGGEEDGVVGEALHTTPEDLMQVAAALGTGERGRYLLAATFGNVHGVHAGVPDLRPDVLRAGQEALAAAHDGARFQYVFHGSSGSSDGHLREAIAHGVVKVNVDTDMQYAFTRAIADHVLLNYERVLRVDGGVGHKDGYDPRKWGTKAEAAMARRTAEACAALGSAGRSLLQATSG